MTKRYNLPYLLRWCLLLLSFTLGASAAAVAQSGPYGNEWIVPGQQYYKVRTTQNGLYRLDNTYLTRAGITSADPSRFQLWRRGKEVAIYVGGNSPTTMDASTFIEFYGQRNDGALDVGMYKSPADHAQKLYSLYTDTAAYFLTIAPTAVGRKRMQQSNPVPVGGAHPYWRYSTTEIDAFDYKSTTLESEIYQPWAEPAEGFFLSQRITLDPRMDSLQFNVPAGPLSIAEFQLVGATAASHRVTMYVRLPGGGRRAAGPAVQFNGYEQKIISCPILPSDVQASGSVLLTLEGDGNAQNAFLVGYSRFTYTRRSIWRADRTAIAFSNDSTLGSAPAYYSLDNLPATVRGFDITDLYNVQRVEGRDEGGSRRGYVFANALPGAKQRRLVLTDESRPRLPLPAQRIVFRNIQPAAHNFLIVSHQALMKSVGTSTNPVRDYATYRASQVGGRYDTLVVTSDQLYNQFHYGEKSALAIRQFALFMLTNSRPKSLLLLGKGLLTGEYGNSNYHRKDPAAYSPTVRDLVPGSTRGASDIFFTADWPHNDYVAKMATGRISAQTSQEVLNYLNKLKEYEDVISRPDSPDLAWRKNALHLIGNRTTPDITEFGAYLDKYKRRIESPLFAGKVIKTYYKPEGLPSLINVSNELNAGLSLINYFGHGDPTQLELDMGNIRTDLSRGNNKGKYPIMFVNGCAAANAYRLPNALYAEDWLLVADKGLIGFMAETSTAYAVELDALQDKTFQLLLNDPLWYGKPVAEIQNEVGRRLQNGALNSYVGYSTLMCTTWHADPALRLFSPAQPDFTFGTPALEIQPVGVGPVLSTAREFKLLVKVRNPGKVTYEPVDISVRRKYDPLSARADTLYTFPGLRQALSDTTYVLVLKNTGSPFGKNDFTVTLDYQSHVAESNEQNNAATLSFTFLKPGITLLSPPEFGIVASNNLRLVGQTNVVREARPFEVELDTVPTFTNPILRTVVTAPMVAEWRPRLPVVAGRDSVVWYWRMRFQTVLEQSENTEWSVSSFRVINSSPGGWSQSHHGQFRRDELAGLDVAAPSGKWSFSNLSQDIALRTQGAGPDSVTFEASYGVQIGSNQLSVLACGVALPDIIVSVIDGASLKSLRTVAGGPYDSCGTAPNRFYHFAASATDNINSPARQQQLLALLTNVPAGAYVALVSVNHVNFASFPPALKAALTVLGSQKINQLQNGDPFVLLAQKGPGGQPAQERTYDPSLPGWRTKQVVSLSGTLSTHTSSGTLTSARIGPAQEWTELHHTIRTEPSDGYTLQLIGLDAQNTPHVLDPNVTSRVLPLGFVSATQYPYLQLQLALRDELNRTAPQIKQLMVTYKGLPEGVVRRDSLLAATPRVYDAATLQQQAATGYLKVPVVFSNVTPIAFGTPLKARVTVRSTGTPGSGGAEKTTEVTLPALVANKALVFNAEADVRDLYGDITMQVDVNLDKSANRLPELYYFNNTLTLPAFHVDNNNLPPVLDVAFDGQHILNGEIVSPVPIITVLMSDDNRLRPITKATAFDVVLIRPDGTQTRVDMNGDNITFTADSAKGTARLEYLPGKAKALVDGIYKLEVQGRDATNTQATTGEKYSIAFEVVNASTITHIYPYPNPITSKAKFVFTLTGSELPRNMKIQIMTLTGKVVREIMMQELGMVRIGNNITDYAWDGTDEFGDRLANGTYLYRVVMDDPTRQFERRKTAGDKSFKNEWGKLVLLR